MSILLKAPSPEAFHGLFLFVTLLSIQVPLWEENRRCGFCPLWSKKKSGENKHPRLTQENFGTMNTIYALVCVRVCIFLHLHHFGCSRLSIDKMSKSFIFQIEEGEGEALLTKAMLQSRFQNLTELVGYSLYVSVTMMTESGE